MSVTDDRRNPQQKRWWSLTTNALISVATLITAVASLITALNGCSPA